MPARFNRLRLAEFLRYYQVGAINTLFGFGLYAAFVRLGLNPYLAQIIAHILGVAFNYVTYRRHVFRAAGPAKARFVLAYSFNYLVSLAALAAASTVIRSPYLAGLVAIACSSLINYFILKFAVFNRRLAA